MDTSLTKSTSTPAELASKPTDEEMEIPAALRREPAAVEYHPDVPIEIVREFVTVEEEGGIPVSKE